MEPTTNQSIRPLADDLVADAAFTIRAIKAYKLGGKDALIALLPEAETLIHREIDDVKAALPAIKSGWKTSEFWLTAGVALAIGIPALLNHPLPIQADAALALATTVYTVIRGLVKKPTPAPAQ
jgi:hypothetical protein